MSQYRVRLSFAQLPDVALDDFAGAIIAGLNGNASYPAPPVTVAQLVTLKQTLQDAVAAQAQGGTTASAAKNTARNALVEGLRKTPTTSRSVLTTISRPCWVQGFSLPALIARQACSIKCRSSASTTARPASSK